LRYDGTEIHPPVQQEDKVWKVAMQTDNVLIAIYQEQIRAGVAVVKKYIVHQRADNGVGKTHVWEQGTEAAFELTLRDNIQIKFQSYSFQFFIPGSYAVKLYASWMIRPLMYADTLAECAEQFCRKLVHRQFPQTFLRSWRIVGLQSRQTPQPRETRTEPVPRVFIPDLARPRLKHACCLQLL
jgi:hypothetical protein